MKRSITIVLSLLMLGITKGQETTCKSLKDAFEPYFKIGVAIGDRQINDNRSKNLLLKEFNSIVAENCMKSESLQRRKGVFDFSASDRFIEFGEAHNLHIVGHCLVWHSQAPHWFFVNEDGTPAHRDTLINRLRNHIHTVVGRYKGKVKGWDVVNEAIEHDGSFRRSPLYNIIGEEFISLAFKFAHEADPEAELYYNDYGMDSPRKREAVVRLIEKLKTDGCRIDAVGMQSHLSFSTPLHEYEKSISAFAATGVKVMVTELDLSVLPWPTNIHGASVEQRAAYQERMNPYTKGLPKEIEKQQTDFFKKLFDIYLRHSEHITRITFWGLTDGDSWKNNWPTNGRTDYPLAFDRAFNAKPFVKEIIGLALERRSSNEQTR